ncbi:SDR family NAD(P)-dependent oxidoreductase, partial [Bombella sp. TMW 2.2559]
MPRTVFVTGVAGFIGFHMARALLARGWTVVGLDSEQSAPEMVSLRLASLQGQPQFHYVRGNVRDQALLTALFAEHPDIDTVLHLAARAGVRQSRLNPHAYIEDNIEGQVSLLEACRSLSQLRHILYASSSAVYGPSAPLPFSEAVPVGEQASFYATTKRMNELTAQTYSHLYGFAQTGMRFFTVYGPLGRPDMACYGFARAIRDGRPLTLWDADGLARDFTYIDDVTEAILQLMDAPAGAGDSRLFNIGYGQPRSVGDLVRCLEGSLG